MGVATRNWTRNGAGALRFTELGFGSAPLGNLNRAIDDAAADALLARAWEGGVRYYDTAPLYGYGLSETRLNRFLRDKPRGDYVLSTKVGRLLRAVPPAEAEAGDKWPEVPSRVGVYDYSYDGVMRSLEFSLERLGLDRVDILYAHDLDVFTHGSQEVLDGHLEQLMSSGYRALLALREEGVIAAFGAGINEWEPCQWLAERGDFDLFLLAGRYTLLEQAAQETFLPLCQERGIGVVIGGPYNSGVLATGARPGAQFNYGPAPQGVLDRIARIEAVCAAHGVRLVDAAFQFPLAHPAVVSVIPGGQGRAEMDSNIAAAQAAIPSDFWTDLARQGLVDPAAPLPA